MRIRSAATGLMLMACSLSNFALPGVASAQPTPWMECYNAQVARCGGDEVCLANRVAGRCAGVEGDPNLPPPITCTQWACLQL
jgi:hypothetical protein